MANDFVGPAKADAHFLNDLDQRNPDFDDHRHCMLSILQDPAESVNKKSIHSLHKHMYDQQTRRL